MCARQLSANANLMAMQSAGEPCYNPVLFNGLRSKTMERPMRFERTTCRVGVCHSIQLSYGRIFTFLGYYDNIPKLINEIIQYHEG